MALQRVRGVAEPCHESKSFAFEIPATDVLQWLTWLTSRRRITRS
jgi:hypothetical protein